MDVGISLYLGSGYQKNKEIIQKAVQAKVPYIFTSLHIPEESVENYQEEVLNLLKLCQQYELSLIVDISPRTLEKLDYQSITELKQINIQWIRLDYGFSNQEIVELAKDFSIVLNASTIEEEQLIYFQKNQVDFSRFIACHNFYPKPLTGLSIQKVAKLNQKLKLLGMKTMGFVAGDKELRGPLYLGLPTIEDQRSSKDVLYHLMELHITGDCDICLIGDVDCTDSTWEKIAQLNQGYVSLEVELDKEYAFLRENIYHDRIDSSDYLIRFQESRGYAAIGKEIIPAPIKERKLGSISIGNSNYQRYSGEVEIAKKNLPLEEKVNIIGQVKQEYLKYLPFIQDGMGVKLI